MPDFDRIEGVAWHYYLPTQIFRPAIDSKKVIVIFFSFRLSIIWFGESTKINTVDVRLNLPRLNVKSVAGLLNMIATLCILI